jgi:hypothetical protein
MMRGARAGRSRSSSWLNFDETANVSAQLHEPVHGLSWFTGKGMKKMQRAP